MIEVACCVAPNNGDHNFLELFNVRRQKDDIQIVNIVLQLI